VSEEDDKGLNTLFYLTTGTHVLPNKDLHDAGREANINDSGELALVDECDAEDEKRKE
jgi:hypothetical protein